MAFRAVIDGRTRQAPPNVIQRESDGAFVPIDEANRDYQEFLSSAGTLGPAVDPEELKAVGER